MRVVIMVLIRKKINQNSPRSNPSPLKKVPGQSAPPYRVPAIHPLHCITRRTACARSIGTWPPSASWTEPELSMDSTSLPASLAVKECARARRRWPAPSAPSPRTLCSRPPPPARTQGPTLSLRRPESRRHKKNIHNELLPYPFRNCYVLYHMCICLYLESWISRLSWHEAGSTSTVAKMK
jgi:hypothetical protein